MYIDNLSYDLMIFLENPDFESEEWQKFVEKYKYLISEKEFQRLRMLYTGKIKFSY